MLDVNELILNSIAGELDDALARWANQSLIDANSVIDLLLDLRRLANGR